MSRLFRWIHLPALILMAILVYLSSRSGSAQGWLEPPLDKLAHMVAYGTLGWSFCLWIREDRWRNSRLKHAIYVVLAVGLFGLSDEIHQSFIPGRDASLGDLGADVAGGILAVASYLSLRAYRLADRLRNFN